MEKRIALGMHTCVDWECAWDTDIFCSLIRMYEVKREELKEKEVIASERDLLIAILYHMEHGSGVEVMPETEDIVITFAKRFPYKTTLGGTATRAAIVLTKLGYRPILHMSSDNSTIRSLLPEAICGIPSHESADGKEHIYPHASVTYPKGVRICVGDIDFVTPRENRILISRDVDSMNMYVSESFADHLTDAGVFLLGCFNEILDDELLADRVGTYRKILERLPKDAIAILEDGCYIKKNSRFFVHDQLRPVLQAVSMNEDELQDYIGRRIDVLGPKVVLEAVQQVYESLRVPTMIVHSASWALAYGQRANDYRKALQGGICMAATRFWRGDDFGIPEYRETEALSCKPENAAFCEQIEAMSDRICCEPCKDMSFVEQPTVVGLGDSFAGGILPAVLEMGRE